MLERRGKDTAVGSTVTEGKCMCALRKRRLLEQRPCAREHTCRARLPAALLRLPLLLLPGRLQLVVSVLLVLLNSCCSRAALPAAPLRAALRRLFQ